MNEEPPGVESGVRGGRGGPTACQFSVYPLRRPHIGDVIEAAVTAAAAEGVSVRVQNLSTLIFGDEDQVFSALRAAYRAAQRDGSAVVVATLTSGMPPDERVAQIQEAGSKARRQA